RRVGGQLHRRHLAPPHFRQPGLQGRRRRLATMAEHTSARTALRSRAGTVPALARCSALERVRRRHGSRARGADDDVVQCLVTSSSVSLWARAPAATLDRRCSTKLVPGIGTTTGERRSSQASATWAPVAAWSYAGRSHFER